VLILAFFLSGLIHADPASKAAAEPDQQ